MRVLFNQALVTEGLVDPQPEGRGFKSRPPLRTKIPGHEAIAWMALGQGFRLFWVFAFCSAAFGLKVESVVWV